MEPTGPVLTACLFFLCISQLFWAHTISVISRKTEQSDLMQVIAWVPILQLAPTLAAGGGRIGRFAAGTLALLLGNVALMGVAAFLGNALGSLLAAVGVGLTGLVCLIYFGRIACKTAVTRDLPAWIGLLIFVPILNFVIYAYIAFHDGWRGPNKIGLAVGAVLILGSAAPTFQALRSLDEVDGLSPYLFLAIAKSNASEMVGLQTQPLRSEPSQSEPNSDETSQLALRQQASLRILYQLKSRFDALETLENHAKPLTDIERAQALGIVQSIRTDLDLHQNNLDSKTFVDLGKHLIELEAGLGLVVAQPSFGRDDDRLFQIGPASTGVASELPTPSYSDPLTPPTRPFPVHASNDCPSGTELHQSNEARGDLEWCQQLIEYGGLRHGWFAKYLTEGQPESMGRYENGLRVGVWTRFYPTGEIRAQAEFKEGLQHGWVVTFDKAGMLTRSERYDSGFRITSR